MPIYEYECRACQKVFEVLQKFSDPPLSACETCGKPVQRLISLSAFHLKGTGWYASDYKKSSAPKGEDKASDSKPADTSSKPSKPCGGGACGA